LIQKVRGGSCGLWLKIDFPAALLVSAAARLAAAPYGKFPGGFFQRGSSFFRVFLKKGLNAKRFFPFLGGKAFPVSVFA
jgi:hypothetical protein